MTNENKVKYHGNNDFKLTIGEFDKHAADYLSEIILSEFAEKGITPEGFHFSLEVTYQCNHSLKGTILR